MFTLTEKLKQFYERSPCLGLKNKIFLNYPNTTANVFKQLCLWIKWSGSFQGDLNEEKKNVVNIWHFQTKFDTKNRVKIQIKVAVQLTCHSHDLYNPCVGWLWSEVFSSHVKRENSSEYLHNSTIAEPFSVRAMTTNSCTNNYSTDGKKPLPLTQSNNNLSISMYNPKHSKSKN